MGSNLSARLLVAGVACAALWMVFSCGEDPITDGDGDGDADGDNDADMDIDADGDGDGDGDADGDGDGDSDPTIVGVVSMNEIVAGDTFANSIQVAFWSVTPAGPTCGENRRDFGDCSITIVTPPTCTEECSEGTACAWDATCTIGECALVAPPAALSAGDVVLTGATFQSPVTCVFAEDTQQYTCDLVATSDWWAPGDPVTVAGTGATFPSFTGDVPAPQDLTMVTELGSFTPADLVGDVELQLTWMPGGASTIWVNVTATHGAGALTLSCATDDDGSFAIPAEGLAALGEGVVLTGWTMSMQRSTMLTVTAGPTGEATLTATGTPLSAYIPAS